MIVAEDLVKTYRTESLETTALNAVSLRLDDGEMVAVMGPSGSGKSTLLHVLGLLDLPSSGRYHFRGEEVSVLDEHRRTDLRRAHIGFVFQSFYLIDELTVAENVELPLLYARLAAPERRRRVSEMLERVSMEHRGDHFPQQLSGGQQQRVAVARALITRPALLLADEPTGNLDSQHGAEIMALIHEANTAGTTVLMVTHSEQCANGCGRVLHFRDGGFTDNAAETGVRFSP